MQVRRRSSFWFILPIFLGLIGGLIAYFIIREDDPKKAKSCLYLGIILVAVWIALFVVPLAIGIALFPRFPMMHDIHYM